MAQTAVNKRETRPSSDLSGERLLNEHQAAERLGLSVKTLRRWRWLKRGVPWIRVGAAIRYAPCDLAVFIEANRQTVSAPDLGNAR
jgi:hypothetical protein